MSPFGADAFGDDGNEPDGGFAAPGQYDVVSGLCPPNEIGEMGLSKGSGNLHWTNSLELKNILSGAGLQLVAMKLSRTRLRPALSKSISSLLPSISAMMP